MRRLSSFRDFDWVLLGFVLVLSVISVLEIKSATEMTKFRGFDHNKLGLHLNECAELLARDDGLEAALNAIKAALQPRLRETAYAIACDLVASDGEATQEVMF